MSELPLVDALAGLGTGSLVVVTGAGISLASGIATFRGNDPDAVWKKDVTELGTRRYFDEDPVGSWQWYKSRFDTVLDKFPNPAHDALVKLEKWHIEQGGQFVLVTQNVDGLHLKAGSGELVEVHGSARRVRCSNNGCSNGAPSGMIERTDIDMQPFDHEPGLDTLPRCDLCSSVLRQHVLWFDEYYDEHLDYQWQRVLDAAQTMRLVLFVGTSFAVGVTDLFLQSAVTRRIPAFAVDPGVHTAPHPKVRLISEKAEVYLPILVDQISSGAPSGD